MSLRLIQPGRPAATHFPVKHSRAGQEIQPIGYLKNGQAVWPVAGGAEEQDDPDADPDENDDEEDEEDEEEDDSSKSKKSTKSKKDEEDDDEEDDEKDSRPHRQAARYRTQLREEQKKNRDLVARLKALEDKDKKPDEIQSRDLADANSKAEKLSAQNAQMAAQLAFFRANTIDWVDANDAFALADREGLFDDMVDEDGTVDARELRRGLRDLAKRKPHLVKGTEEPKARGRKNSNKDTDEEEEEEQSSPSPKSMNNQRRGTKGTADRAALAKKFPVLNRL